MAAGAAAGKFLQYESGAPTVAAQTAYGIEAEVEGYGAAFDPHAMTFMDFRRHHTGLWPSTAPKCGQGPPAQHCKWHLLSRICRLVGTSTDPNVVPLRTPCQPLL